jgi:hypothetical protein
MWGIIYKIIHNQSNWVYVGSTFDDLRYRWRDHKTAFERWEKDRTRNNMSCYDFFLKYGIENFKAVVVKYYDVVDRKHLEAYETLWINKLKSCNKIQPFCIKKLSDLYYRNTHKKEIAEQSKKYREENKETLRQKKQNYYELHKEEIKNRWKETYSKNKDKRTEKVKCDECEMIISKQCMSRHKKRWHH